MQRPSISRQKASHCVDMANKRLHLGTEARFPHDQTPETNMANENLQPRATVRSQNRAERSSLRRRRRAQKRLLAICANCWRQCDRENRTLCSVCAQKRVVVGKAYSARLKRATFEAYGGCKCACCGEATFEFLSIDHIDNSGAVHRKHLRHGEGDNGGGGMRTYLWLKRNGYPPGFRVLCRNCNAAYGELGYCPHQSSHLTSTAPRENLVCSLTES